jgi:hypothetical protein
MRFLIHGSLTPAAVEAVQRHGHVPTPFHDVVAEGEEVDADELLKRANQKQLDVLTTDKALATRLYDSKQKFGRSIVHLQLAGGEVEQDDAIDRLFARYKAPKPGMLYTVTETRVKVRQLPGV